MENSFYITGGTLPPDAGSYITRRADTDLLEGMRRGEFCYVLNTRQMGKSSLMSRTAQVLRLDGDTVVVLDLTAIGQNLTVEQWYAGLLGRLSQQTGEKEALFDFWRANRELGPMQRFLEAIRTVLLTPEGHSSRIPKSLVIFVDEIDAVRSLPFAADEFFAGIRECYNRRSADTIYEKLTFCLLGVATPSDLIKDTRISPFNVGRRVELNDFTLEEAKPLAIGLNRPDAAEVINRIYYWTNGHPYLTQRLCRAVAEGSVGTGDWGPGVGETANTQYQIPMTHAHVDGLVDKLFLSRSAQETDDNLTFVRSRILRSDVDVSSLLDLYLLVCKGKRVRDDDTNPLCGVLRLSGIVSPHRGDLTARNRLYETVFDAKWVQENRPDADVRRQRKAYRLGVMRTAVVASIIIGVILGLAYRSKVLADIARRATKTADGLKVLAERRVYASQMVQLQQAYDKRDLTRACNLLKQTEPFPSRGFEWYYWNRILHNELLSIPAPGPLSMMAWSRNGSWIITQTQSAITTPHIDLWDAVTGARLRTLPGRTERLNGVLSPIAATLVALVAAPGGQMGSVQLYNPTSGMLLGTLPDIALEATLSADGSQILTTQQSGNKRYFLKAWNSSTRRLIYSVELPAYPTFGHSADTGSISSSADGGVILCGGFRQNGSTLTVLDGKNGRILIAPPGKDYEHQAISADGKFIATCDATEPDPCQIRLYQRGKKTPINLEQYGGQYSATDLAFTPDGKTLICTGGSRDTGGRIWLWNVPTGKRAYGPDTHSFAGHSQPAYYPTVSPDGAYILTTGLEQTLRQWDMKTGRQLGSYAYSVITSAISPDSAKFLVTDGLAVQVYPKAPASGVTVTKHPGYERVNFTADSRTIMYGAPAPSTDANTPYVQYGVLDLASGIDRRFDMGKVNTWYFSKSGMKPGESGRSIVYSRTNAAPGIVAELHDIATGKLLALVSGTHRATTLMLAEDDTLATSSGKENDVVQVWRRVGNTYSKLRDIPVDASNVRFLKFLNRGQILICAMVGEDSSAWDMRSGAKLYSIPLGRLTLRRNIAEAPNGQFFMAISSTTFYTTRLTVYDCKTGKPILGRDNVVGFDSDKSISADSRYLVYQDYLQNARIIDFNTKQDLPDALNVGGYIMCAVWSPDGQRLWTGTDTGTCRLWDTATGSEVLTLMPSPHGLASELALSPDGKTVVAACAYAEEYCAFIWSAQPTKPVNQMKR